MTDAEWRCADRRLRCLQHETDRRHNETFDRRRVDPPAGCRAAAEPAILAGRWSELLTTEEQLKNNRIAADRSDVWGRRAVKRFLAALYMTRTGRYRWETSGMDVIELARTIQADRDRAIAAEARRRRLMATDQATVQTAPSARTIGAPQRPASTGALSR